jgi:hypothetical protein
MLFSCAAVATACAVRSMSPRRAVKVRMICPDLRPSTAPSPPRPKSRGFLFAEQLRQLRDIWPRSAALVLPHEVRKRLQPKRDRVAFLPTCRLATFFRQRGCSTTDAASWRTCSTSPGTTTCYSRSLEFPSCMALLSGEKIPSRACSLVIVCPIDDITSDFCARLFRGNGRGALLTQPRSLFA